MILDATTQSIQVSKLAATTTTDPDCYAAFVDNTTTTFVPSDQRTAITGTGDVTVVAAPAASTQRQVKYMTIFNRDTVQHTFTVEHDLSGTDFVIGRLVLQPNEWAEYIWEKGWTIHDANGFPKENIGIGMSALAASGGTITSGQASFQDSNGQFFGVDGQTITGRAVPNMNSSYFINYAMGATTASILGTVNGSMMVFPLMAVQDLRFPGVMTVSSMYIAMSGSQTNTAASSTSASFTFSLGLYTLNGSTLQLLNSASATASVGSGSDCTSGMHGPRWLQVATSNWSAQLSLSNAVYYLGLLQTTAGTSKSISWMGMRRGITNQWSGFFGSQTSSATSRGMDPFTGILTTAGIPTTIQASQLNKANASAGFVPLIALNNLSSLL